MNRLMSRLASGETPLAGVAESPVLGHVSENLAGFRRCKNEEIL